MDAIVWFIGFPVVLLGLLVPLWVGAYRRVRKYVRRRSHVSPLVEWMQGILAWGVVTVYLPLQPVARARQPLRAMLCGIVMLTAGLGAVVVPQHLPILFSITGIMTMLIWRLPV